MQGDYRAAQAPRHGVLWVPDWPIAAAVLEGVLPAYSPTVLCKGSRVIATSAQARRLGVRVGMSQRSAQSLAPGLVIEQDAPTQHLRAFEPVLQAAEAVVADLIMLRPGLATFGIEGAATYYGSEEKVAEELIRAGASAGVEAHVGAGAGLLTAILAARESKILSREETQRFLFPHLVETLEYAGTTHRKRQELYDLIGVWRRLGLLRLKDVAGVPRDDIASRFGQVGVWAHRLSRGEGGGVQAGERSSADLSVGCVLDPPATTLDETAFVTQRLATELYEALTSRGLACEVLRVSAREETGYEHSRGWRLEGVVGIEEFTERVRWQLSGWLEGRSDNSPSAPLARIDLSAEENYPAGLIQRGLWGETQRGDEQAAKAARRVQGLLGAGAVLLPVLQGGRSPRERVRYVAWGDETKPFRPLEAPWPGQIPEPLPTTVFQQPLPVTLTSEQGRLLVHSNGALSGEPCTIRINERTYPIHRWAGPWPIHGRWWEGQRMRAYVQIVTPQNAWLVAGSKGIWVAEGRYD